MALTISAETEARLSALMAEGEHVDIDSFLNELMDGVAPYSADELAEIRAAIAEAEEQSERGEGMLLEDFLSEQGIKLEPPR